MNTLFAARKNIPKSLNYFSLMPLIAESKYLGELRCVSLHLKSKNAITTDAPLDNHGKGESFSPTDLLCVSLATCMMTIMGIAAKARNLRIENTDCEIEKIMSPSPRKVAEIIINFSFKENNFSEEEKEALRRAAYSCPVALSLHPDLKKTVNFYF